MKGREKSFDSLYFDAISQSSRQTLSPSIIFISSLHCKEFTPFSFCHGGEENQILILCQVCLKQKDIFVGCCGVSQALLSFLLHRRSVRQMSHVAMGARKRKGIIKAVMSACECHKFAASTDARKEVVVCII